MKEIGGLRKLRELNESSEFRVLKELRALQDCIDASEQDNVMPMGRVYVFKSRDSDGHAKSIVNL